MGRNRQRNQYSHDPACVRCVPEHTRLWFAGAGRRKVFTHLQITLSQQFIGLRSNDYPIALYDRVVQQCIADRAAD